MNFDLSDQQRLLQSTVDGVLEKESSLSAVRSFFDSDDDLDLGVWGALGPLGVLGLQLPETFGGAGLELLDLACVAERLGYHATPGPFLGHAVAGIAIELAGSEAQRREWLPRLASGECIASIAFGEPGARWQPEEWRLQSDDGATLDGRKDQVLSGSSADLIVVGLEGGGLGLIDTSVDGVVLETANVLDRTRRLSNLTLERAAFERMPGGPDAAARVRDAALVLLSADAYGGASRCVELAVAYAKQREQFGQTIGHFQALKHQLANLSLDAEPCRALVWYAAYAWDHVPDQAARAAAHAKSHVTDRFLQIGRSTVETHGGIGYTWECEVHYWLKRAVFDRAFLGSPRVHRLRAANLAGW